MSSLLSGLDMQQYERDRKWRLLLSVVAIAYVFGNVTISKVNLGFVTIEGSEVFLEIMLFSVLSYFLLSYYQCWLKIILPEFREDIDNSLCEFLTRIALREIKEYGPEICEMNQISQKVKNPQLIDCTNSWFVYIHEHKCAYRDVRMQLNYPSSPRVRNSIDHVVYHFSAERIGREKPKFWLHWAVKEATFLREVLPFIIGILGFFALVTNLLS
jgi:hypothetical protein